jgi:hypothetical protein
VPDAAKRSGKQASDLIPLLVAAVLIPAALGSSKTIFNDGDVSWHTATGQWILDHHAIPHADPFSFTRLGTPWVPIEWLAEVVYALTYRLDSYAGVAALVTAALIGLHAIVFSNSLRFVRPWLAVCTVVAMDVVLIPMMLARPHLLTWPLLAFWTWLMLRAREQDRAPPLAVALLMTLWANLHGGWPFGLAIAGAFGAEALVASQDRARALRQWLIFGAACIVAVFINAIGIDGVLHPFRIAGLKTLTLIDEWKPSSPAVTPWFFAVLGLTLALIAWKRPRLHPVRWVLLAVLLAFALWQVRQQAMLAIVAAMVLPAGFIREAQIRSAAFRKDALFASVLALMVIAARGVMPLSPSENESNPWKLIAAVPSELRSQPVLNGFSMGGPLILSGIRPYIDGRGDVYGDAMMLDYARLSKGDAAALSRAVDRWDIRWAILPHDYSRLIGLLDRSGQWRRIASDQAGVIYVRTGA